MRRGLVLVVGVLLLAGCASAKGGGTPPAAGSESDPVDLVNLWRVTADGEGPDTWWRADAGSYDLIRPCGIVSGGWRATAHLFVASPPFSWHEDCSADGNGQPSVPWLEQAITYERDGNGWRLLDADGTTLATLQVDGAPGPIEDAIDSFREPPEVTDELRAALAPPAPLPDGLTPVTAETLAGRWDVPAEDLVDFGTGALASMSPEKDPYPHLQVLDDGTWEGTDGCNGAGGVWAVDDDGWVLITSGASTEMGCDGAPAPSWFASAARAGLEGDTLVLTDHDGTEIARLVRG